MHRLQLLPLAAPNSVENVPAWHNWQKSDFQKPTPVLNVPATQLAHVELIVAPDAVEYVPAEQSWQTVELDMPVPVWNVPGTHSEQFSEAIMPVPVWYVPAWHSVQLMRLEAARPVEYVPIPQARHVWTTELLGSMDGLYVPEGHASQFTPDQLAGGAIWPVILGIVAFQPPTPVNPALHLQAD